MSDWQVLPDTDAEAAVCFSDLDRVFALDGELVARDPASNVVRVRINGLTYYVKRYAGLGKKPLQRWLATPRVQLEWENLQHFAAWGIPTARRVACGLEKQQGRFVRGALITAEIPNTTDLRRLARNQDARLKSRHWWNGISRQVADIARCLHDQRFAHGDLKWRNLLVDDAARVYLIDCPSGGFWWPPFLEYRIVKDLACLDKLARRNLTRSQRLRFYLDYARKKRLEQSDKQRIRKIVAFFDGRDEDLDSAASLRAAGRTPLPRRSVALENDQSLKIERWLRILPGKRLTAEGDWQGRRVLVKLFIAGRGSERHWGREWQGTQSLKSRNLPTPELLARGQLAGGGHFILYDFLENARTPDASSVNDLVIVFEQVGRMHAQGLLQDDAHLDNFLLCAGSPYLIDGASIRQTDSASACAENLGLLLAQLTPAADAALRPALLAAYVRAWPAAISVDDARLSRVVAQARQKRLEDYLDKCLRDCSEFKVAKRTDRFIAVRRDAAKALTPLLHDPDAWLAQGKPLKRGTTATLSLVEMNSRLLVIKRYNIKGAAHALSRCWRPSRAWRAWIEGHRLQFLGLATPRPLALIERRLGPLRGQAWLISEYCPGERLSAHLLPYVDSPPEAEWLAIKQLFDALAAARITHGDLKASNLLWHAGKVTLVDLDAMRQHGSDTAFRRAWRKDRERLLRNWPVDSVLHARLAAVLPKA